MLNFRRPPTAILNLACSAMAMDTGVRWPWPRASMLPKPEFAILGPGKGLGPSQQRRASEP
jgi:hypothetical protein